MRSHSSDAVQVAGYAMVKRDEIHALGCGILQVNALVWQEKSCGSEPLLYSHWTAFVRRLYEH
jgi:hypothetical protein